MPSTSTSFQDLKMAVNSKITPMPSRTLISPPRSAISQGPTEQLLTLRLSFSGEATKNLPPEARQRVEGVTQGATAAGADALQTVGGGVKGIVDTAGNTVRLPLPYYAALSYILSMQRTRLMHACLHRSGPSAAASATPSVA